MALRKGICRGAVASAILLALLASAWPAAAAPPPKRDLPPFDPSWLQVPGNSTGGGLSPNIVGGSATGANKYPWVAFLGWVDPSSNSLSPACTGSLISPTLVLTAAHCVKMPLNRWIVWINRADWSAPADGRRGFYFSVKRIWTPPNWNPSTTYGDIALFQIELSNARSSPLGTSFYFGNPSGSTNWPTPVAINLGFPSIPSTNPASVGDARLKRGQAVGWGLMRRADGQGFQSANSLQEVQVPIVAHDQCRGYFGNVDDSVVCAGGDAGRNVCNGDSGGPLYMTDDAGRPVVVGVTSKGPTQCGIAGVPAVWTRVSKFASWIRQIVATSEADVAGGRIWVDPNFRNLRAATPVIAGLQQGSNVRPVRPRVTKIARRKLERREPRRPSPSAK
ncbi:trypsin-like cysteine/serine peptidase domain-containing protein [Hyaloraphidium curvatum]|nr:trypsin-like cysteine/serine peptidase domain-containing protein [Hyaloraphidium curvatum]